MVCPTCRVLDLSEIRLRVRDSDVTLRACVRCEQRWWHRDGEQVDLDEVLHLITPAVTLNV